MRGSSRVIALPLLAAIAVVTGITVDADSWLLPKKQTYYSSNKRYNVEVTPRAIVSQLKYFQDRVEGKEPAGARSSEPVTRPARASFGVRQLFWYRQRSDFQLVNDVAPVNATVSDDGDFIVTLDDWHGMGYGDAVVVIYRSNGQVVRRLRLEDLVAPSDTRHFKTSVSSIWWRDSFRIDSTRDQLIILVSSQAKTLPEGRARQREVRVDLRSGNVLTRTEQFWPGFEEMVSVSPALNPLPTDKSPKLVCDETYSFDSVPSTTVPSVSFLDRAATRNLPTYPPIAEAARITGRVVVEVLVDSQGSVRCVRGYGPPLIREAAAEAARGWRFRPSEIPTSGLVVGQIEFQFKIPWQ